MLVRIYPRIRYYDGEILNFALAKKPTKKIIASMYQKVKEVFDKAISKYAKDAESYNSFIPEYKDVYLEGQRFHSKESYPILEDIIKGITKSIEGELMPVREDFTEVRMDLFVEHLQKWFPRVMDNQYIKLKDGFVEVDLDDDFISMYMYIYDYQILDGDKFINAVKKI